MPAQGSDFIVISRAGAHYKILMSEVLSYIQSQMGTSEYRVANIAARNAIDGNMSVGDRVMVDDATADATVSAGWALYQWLGSGVWRKIAEQESMDVTVGGATNLSYTASATQGTVVSDTGNDAVLPLANGTDAGLMSPAQFTKMSFIGVTASVDLDDLASKKHDQVTLAGTASTNPLTLTGQQIGFNISALSSAP